MSNMADTSQTDSMNVENSKSPEASNGLGEAMEVDEAPSETNLDSEKKVSQPADLSESPSSKGESSKKSLPTPANDSSEDSDDEFKGFPEDEADASRRDLFKEYIEESSETKSKTEDYMKPFKRGWKRELVYRSTTASGEKQGNRTDIYYHSPAGKRFRSSREVAESLTGGDLTIENFSFHKEPLGIGDPEKEIIRDARPMEKAPPAESLTSPSQAKRTPQPNKVKPTKPEQPKVQASSKVSSKSTPVRKATSKSESVSDRDGESLDESDWDMGQKKTTNGLSPRSSAVAKHSVKLVQLPPQYSPMNFNFMLNAVTKSMLSIFQYLKVHELLRATQACKNWHFIATHHSLWETVKMKNSKICDFDGFGKTLSKHNTRTLDLRKMIMPETPEATSEMWRKMADTIRTLPRLQQIDFGRCTPSAIEAVAGSCPQLESIVSLSMRGTEINMSLLANCQNLVELKLKSFGGFDVKNITALKQLTKLKTLALTTVKNLEGVENALPEGLENLELGECVKISEKFATAGLAKLSKLRRLRLERGQGSNCPTMALVQTVSELPNLAQLELINFDIKPGFDRNIAKCSNIKVLLIIPTYVTQSATTNHVVMGGVSKLSSSLQYFIWGLTVELLKVTDLFIDQVESGARGGGNAPKKSGTGDSIPILKPISDDRSSGEGASQVDILALPKLQRVLSTLLPQTKIKILKIPFSATWRQTVTDVPA